jgi:hypothetical protein
MAMVAEVRERARSCDRPGRASGKCDCAIAQDPSGEDNQEKKVKASFSEEKEAKRLLFV